MKQITDGEFCNKKCPFLKKSSDTKMVCFKFYETLEYHEVYTRIYGPDLPNDIYSDGGRDIIDKRIPKITHSCQKEWRENEKWKAFGEIAKTAIKEAIERGDFKSNFKRFIECEEKKRKQKYFQNAIEYFINELNQYTDDRAARMFFGDSIVIEDHYGNFDKYVSFMYRL